MDPKAFAGASSYVDEKSSRPLMATMFSTDVPTLETNLRPGMGGHRLPVNISIYPKSFADKDKVSALDTYNKDNEAAGATDTKVITYPDIWVRSWSVTKIKSAICGCSSPSCRFRSWSPRSRSSIITYFGPRAP